MRKSHALLISVLITLLVFFLIFLTNLILSTYLREEVVVKRVIDGDTIVLKDNRTIRLLNINAPEKDSPLHTQAENFLKQFENRTVEIQVTGKDKYNRYLARIYSPNYVNLMLVKYGLSSIFLTDFSERKEYKLAEVFAIEHEQGMWKKSPYFGCINYRINAEKEILTLTKNCSFSLPNSYIKDESRKTYLIKNDFYSINLHSFHGTDNSTDLFWQSSTPIWNNDADTFYLFDSDDRLITYGYYGY